MRLVIAVVMGVALASIGIGMLRSLGARRPHAVLPEPEPPPADVRVTYWCQNCGTELLLIRRGSDAAPRHCGEGMSRREEASRG